MLPGFWIFSSGGKIVITFFGSFSLKSNDGVFDASTITSGSNLSEIFSIVSVIILYNCNFVFVPYGKFFLIYVSHEAVIRNQII